MYKDDIIKAIHILECDRAYCAGADMNTAAYLYGIAIELLKNKLSEL